MNGACERMRSNGNTGSLKEKRKKRRHGMDMGRRVKRNDERRTNSGRRALNRKEQKGMEECN